jgi:hypothetical protein
MNFRMLHKLTGIAAWGLLAFILYATISPIQDRPTLLTSTSFEHLAAFAVLGAPFSLAYPWQVALVCLIVLGSAVLLEILQLQTPDRHGRVPDAGISMRMPDGRDRRNYKNSAKCTDQRGKHKTRIHCALQSSSTTQL